jgi:hypothetical protein
MDIGNGAGQHAVLDFFPLRDTWFFKPYIQRVEIGEAGHRLPQTAPRILNVLLDCPFSQPEAGLQKFVSNR